MRDPNSFCWSTALIINHIASYRIKSCRIISSHIIIIYHIIYYHLIHYRNAILCRMISFHIIIIYHIMYYHLRHYHSISYHIVSYNIILIYQIVQALQTTLRFEQEMSTRFGKPEPGLLSKTSSAASMSSSSSRESSSNYVYSSSRGPETEVEITHDRLCNYRWIDTFKSLSIHVHWALLFFIMLFAFSLE